MRAQRPKSGKIHAKLTWHLFWRQNQFGWDQGIVQLQGFNLLQINPNWLLGNWTLNPHLKCALVSLPWVHPLSHFHEFIIHSHQPNFLELIHCSHFSEFTHRLTSPSSPIISLLQVHPLSHFSKFTHCLTSPSSPIVPLLQVHVHTLTLHGFHTVVNIERFFGGLELPVPVHKNSIEIRSDLRNSFQL